MQWMLAFFIIRCYPALKSPALSIQPSGLTSFPSSFFTGGKPPSFSARDHDSQFSFHSNKYFLPCHIPFSSSLNWPVKWCSQNALILKPTANYIPSNPHNKLLWSLTKCCFQSSQRSSLSESVFFHPEASILLLFCNWLLPSCNCIPLTPYFFFTLPVFTHF